MIAASAAQLLLGRPEIKLRHFERFQVYANAYRSDRNDRWHQGEVQPARVSCASAGGTSCTATRTPRCAQRGVA